MHVFYVFGNAHLQFLSDLLIQKLQKCASFVVFYRNMFPPNLVEACTKQVTFPTTFLSLSCSYMK